MLGWGKDQGITQKMKEEKRGEKKKQREARRTRGTIMTFKRREKELWEAKLQGGLCGTCRTLHDSEQDCDINYTNWQMASRIIHQHKQQQRHIQAGLIKWQKHKHLSPTPTTKEQTQTTTPTQESTNETAG